MHSGPGERKKGTSESHQAMLRKVSPTTECVKLCVGACQVAMLRRIFYVAMGQLVQDAGV